MADDYLWDRSGAPDPEVERLESLLSPYRHRGEAPPLPEGGIWRHRRSGRRMLLLAAGLVGLLLGGALVFQLLQASAGWEVVTLAGAPEVGGQARTASAFLEEGEGLVTGPGSRALLRVGRIGEVLVEPGTRLRLESAQATDHRLSLAEGAIQATISAPPRWFQVDTPLARAVDLGCMYHLRVEPSGAALLRVEAGWVAFEEGGVESFVPAGAYCRTEPGFGPGAPWFHDASRAFAEALAVVDFGTDPNARAEALETLLAEARPRDGLTLWHLLRRIDSLERTRVHDRLAELVPPPPGVTREGILAGDRRMLDRWWKELGLGSSSWWRLWKQDLP